MITSNCAKEKKLKQGDWLSLQKKKLEFSVLPLYIQVDKNIFIIREDLAHIPIYDRKKSKVYLVDFHFTTKFK